MKKIMPSKASINAGRHPYLRKDFEWPVREEPPKSLGPLLNDEEMEILIQQYREDRIFSFPTELISLLGIKTERFQISKDYLNELLNAVFNQYLSLSTIIGLRLLREDLIDFVKLDENNWLAETTWIKA